MHHSDGRTTYILDPFLSNERWPGVFVDSSSFNKLTPPEKLYEQASAFLQASKVLCETAGQSGNDVRWSQGATCLYCLNLATELFLKACISRSKGVDAALTHEISKLLKQYAELLPSPEFHFPTPWAFSTQDIEQALGFKVFNSVDRKPDQLYRYGIGRDGAESAGGQFFNPSYIFNYVEHLKIVWQRAWDEVSKA